MVDDDKIEEWIQGKLDDGIEPERIKKSLENTGHDPSLVDDMQDPFSGEDNDVEEPDFIESSEDHEETNATGINESEDVETSSTFENSDTEQKNDDNGSGFSLPEIKAPDFSIPDFNWKKISVVVLTVLIASTGGLIVFTGVVSAPELSTLDDTARDVMNVGGSSQCPNADTSIMSASISDGKTWMKVDVSGGSTDTVAEVFEGEELKASQQKTIKGVSVVIVDGVGTRATFKAVGCREGDEVSLT